MDHFVIYVLCLSRFLVCLMHPCGLLLGKGWSLALLYVILVFFYFIVFLSFCHAVSWLRCGTSL